MPLNGQLIIGDDRVASAASDRAADPALHLQASDQPAAARLPPQWRAQDQPRHRRLVDRQYLSP
jgi:hypothetical protein